MKVRLPAAAVSFLSLEVSDNSARCERLMKVSSGEATRYFLVHPKTFRSLFPELD